MITTEQNKSNTPTVIENNGTLVNNGAGTESVVVAPITKEEKSEVINVDVKEKPKTDKITLNFGKGAKVGNAFIQTKTEAEVLNNQGQQNPVSPNNAQAQLQTDIKTLNSIDDEVKKFQSHVTTDEEFLDMAGLILMFLDWILGFAFARFSKDPKAKASHYEADAEKIKKLKPYVAKMLMQMKRKFPLWFFMMLLFISAYAPVAMKAWDKRKEIEEEEEKKKQAKKIADEQKRLEAEKLANAEKLKQTVQPVQPRELIIRHEAPVVKREIVVPQPPPVTIEPAEKEMPKPQKRVDVRELVKKANKKNNNESTSENTSDADGAQKIVVPQRKGKNQVPRIPVRTGRKTND